MPCASEEEEAQKQLANALYSSLLHGQQAMCSLKLEFCRPLPICNMIPVADHVVTKGSSLNRPSLSSSPNRLTGLNWAEIGPKFDRVFEC